MKCSFLTRFHQAKEAYSHVSTGQHETVRRHKWNLVAPTKHCLTGQHITAVFHVLSVEPKNSVY